MKQKAFFINFKWLRLKQVKLTFLVDESPTPSFFEYLFFWVDILLVPS